MSEAMMKCIKCNGPLCFPTLPEPAIIIVMGLLVGFIVLTLTQTVMSVGSLKL